jgi:predicted dehydrogenase
VGEDNATRPIGLGFLGCGDFGNFQKDKILGGDPKFELKEVWLGRRSGPEAKSNLVNNPEIEAVYVCTPCAHHSINSIEAMRGGKHVHVEKPLYGLKETILQSQASMKILYIGYHRRQSDTWLAMRASLQARCLTNISPAKLIFTAIDPCSPDQDTETSLEDLKTVIGQTLVHEIDVLTWTYPDSNFEVTSVSPQPNSGSCLKGIITHPNGMKTEIELINTKTGADAKRYLNRCMVHSTDGSIEKFEVEYFANTEHMCYVYKEAYQKCWAEFYSLVRGDSYDVESRLDSYLKTDRVLGAFHLAAEEFFKK